KISAPKNITSVAMKTHMPSCAVSVTCSSVANCGSGARLRIGDAILRDEAPILGIVLIRCRVHDLRACEIVLGRRRARAPFEPGGTPGIGRCVFFNDTPPT